MMVQAHHHPEKRNDEPFKSSAPAETKSKGRKHGTKFTGHLASPAF
jgi:hypothetical protein